MGGGGGVNRLVGSKVPLFYNLFDGCLSCHWAGDANQKRATSSLQAEKIAK